jgi:hypothetical protein
MQLQLAGLLACSILNAFPSRLSRDSGVGIQNRNFGSRQSAVGKKIQQPLPIQDCRFTMNLQLRG